MFLVLALPLMAAAAGAQLDSCFHSQRGARHEWGLMSIWLVLPAVNVVLHTTPYRWRPPMNTAENLRKRTEKVLAEL